MRKYGLILKKLSCRWQSAWRLCTPMLRSPWHKTLRSTVFRAVLPRAAIWWMTAIYWPHIPTFTYPSPIWRRQSNSSYRVHIWYGKTRMTGLQSGEGRMMIDSVVWAQYINVTDRQPRRPVAPEAVWQVCRRPPYQSKIGMAPHLINLATTATTVITITQWNGQRHGVGPTAWWWKKTKHSCYVALRMLLRRRRYDGRLWCWLSGMEILRRTDAVLEDWRFMFFLYTGLYLLCCHYLCIYWLHSSTTLRSWSYKLNNNRVFRCIILGSKCTRKCLAARLRPDPLEELTALPRYQIP